MANRREWIIVMLGALGSVTVLRTAFARGDPPDGPETPRAPTSPTPPRPDSGQPRPIPKVGETPAAKGVAPVPPEPAAPVAPEPRQKERAAKERAAKQKAAEDAANAAKKDTLDGAKSR